MSAPVVILACTEDATLAERLRVAASAMPGAVLRLAGPVEDALVVAAHEEVSVVVFDPGPAGPPDGMKRSTWLREAAPRATFIVVAEPAGDAFPDPAAVGDFEELLRRDSSGWETSLRLAAAARATRTRIDLAAIGAAVERLENAQEDALENMLALLDSLLEQRVPGALERAAHIEDLAVRIAERFEVPEALLEDLGRAARLHEIGKVAVGFPTSASSSPVGGEDWEWLASTHAALAHFPALASAAELIGALEENWDGTGRPARLLRGQIPLRSRILRVLIDFQAALNAPGPPRLADLLDRLEEHAGTRYDPLVIVHLREVVDASAGTDWRGNRTTLPIDALDVGMVLAEDLFTDSGLKLLSRHAVLTPGALASIRQRHQREPILRGATIERAATA